MKEEKTKSRKKLLYYLILTVSVLLLVTATVLTVYFVTEKGDKVIEAPPQEEDPSQPDGPAEGDDTPTGGEDAVRFVSPLAYESVTVSFNEIYWNTSTGTIYRHKAVDLAAEEGTAVCAMAEGTVLSVSYSEETGNYITIDHGDGLVTLYRYVEPVAGLKAGDKVERGGQIATVAAAYGSEHRDGTHLHLEIFLNGEAVDPADYLDPVLDEK